MLSLDPVLKRILRDNKNTRLHVLFILISQSAGDVPNAISARDIADELTCNRDTINDALRGMAHDGYAAKTRVGWIATVKARQLPLAELLLKSGMEAHQSGLLPDGDKEAEAECGKTPHLMRKISALDVVVDQQQALLALADQQQQAAPNAEKFRPADETEALRALFDKFSVVGKKRRALLADDWVTVHRFSSWQAIAELADLANPVGYAIVRCENHEEPPAVTPALDQSVAASWMAIIQKARTGTSLK